MTRLLDTTRSIDADRRARRPDGRPSQNDLTIGVVALGVLLALSSLLGPLVLDVIDYRYGTSMSNQAIGLDAVALAVGAPLALDHHPARERNGCRRVVRTGEHPVRCGDHPRGGARR